MAGESSEVVAANVAVKNAQKDVIDAQNDLTMTQNAYQEALALLQVARKKEESKRIDMEIKELEKPPAPVSIPLPKN